MPIHGRADKKFCSDYCRNHYHNHRNQSSNAYVRQINYVLRKNRRILAKFNTHGTTKIRKSTLIKEGFDFDHMTSIYTSRKGHIYFFCYEQGYLPLDKDMVYLLVKGDYCPKPVEHHLN